MLGKRKGRGPARRRRNKGNRRERRSRRGRRRTWRVAWRGRSLITCKGRGPHPRNRKWPSRAYACIRHRKRRKNREAKTTADSANANWCSEDRCECEHERTGGDREQTRRMTNRQREKNGAEETRRRRRGRTTRTRGDNDEREKRGREQTETTA